MNANIENKLIVDDVEASDKGHMNKPIVQIGLFGIIILVIIKLPQWLDDKIEGGDTKPTVTFEEWTRPDAFQPEIEKKRGFADIDAPIKEQRSPKLVSDANLLPQADPIPDRGNGKESFVSAEWRQSNCPSGLDHVTL